MSNIAPPALQNMRTLSNLVWVICSNTLSHIIWLDSFFKKSNGIKFEVSPFLRPNSRTTISSFSRRAANGEPIIPPQPKIIESSFHYYPKTQCDEDEECTVHQKKFGSFELTEKIKYSGKLSQEFDFTSFPFDSQNVELIIQSDNYAFEKEDHTYFTDLYFSSYSDRKLETSYANLNNNSWDYTNYYYYHGSQYIDEIDNRIADLAVGFKIERKYVFYVFKIFFHFQDYHSLAAKTLRAVGELTAQKRWS